MAFNTTSRISGRGGHITDQLSAYLDGELAQRELSGVEAHLKGCADCARELETLRATRQMMRSMQPMAAPRTFVLSPEMVAPRQQERQAPVFAWLPRLRVATAAMAVLLAVVLSADALSTVSPGSAATRSNPAAASVPVAEAESTTAAADASTELLMAFPTATVPGTGGNGGGQGTGGEIGGPPSDAAGGTANTTESTATEATADPHSPLRTVSPLPYDDTTIAEAGDQPQGDIPAVTSAGEPPAAKDPETAGTEDVGQTQQEAQQGLDWLWFEIPLGLLVLALGTGVILMSRRQT